MITNLSLLRFQSQKQEKKGKGLMHKCTQPLLGAKLHTEQHASFSLKHFKCLCGPVELS